MRYSSFETTQYGLQVFLANLRVCARTLTKVLEPALRLRLATISFLCALYFSGSPAWAQSEEEGDYLIEILKLFGPWGAALLTGLFAVYQFRRRSAFELEVDRQRQQAQNREREVEKLTLLAQRQSQRLNDFRLDRLQPFMNALNRTLIHSYAGMLTPSLYGEIVGHIPVLRRVEGKCMGDWFKAAEEMSDLRMQLMLSVDRDDVPLLMQLLQDHTTLAKDFLDKRHQFFQGQSIDSDISDSHRAYVAKGFELMLAVKDALIREPGEHQPLTEEMRIEMAKDMALPLERASLVSVPFGLKNTCAWVGCWACNEGIASYELGENGLAIFEEEITKVTKVFYDDLQSKLTVKMLRTGSDESSNEFKYYLSVIFGAQEDLNNFTNFVLPAVKKQVPDIWVGHLTPSEFIVDLPEKQ